MDKIIERTRFEYPDGSSVNSNAVDVVWNKVKELLTPKLQWKSRNITNNGGDNLLAIQYYLQDSTFVVVILDNKLTGKCCVRWDFKHVFEGTLEECKKYCSDKILEDFLKLCQ